MDWNIKDGEPIWKQLVRHLTLAIATGEYPAGGRIPPVRELALDAGVNPNTMQRALAQLETDGLVVTNRTAGRTVTEEETVLQTLRNTLADTAMVQYFSQMAQLGFSKTEATALLKEQEGMQ